MAIIYTYNLIVLTPHSKNENLYALAPAQTKRMQPIAPFWSNLQKNTGPIFCKLLLNGASHDTMIGCISLVWAGAKKYKFSFLLCTGPLTLILNVIAGTFL